MVVIAKWISDLYPNYFHALESKVKLKDSRGGILLAASEKIQLYVDETSEFVQRS